MQVWITLLEDIWWAMKESEGFPKALPPPRRRNSGKGPHHTSPPIIKNDRQKPIIFN